MTEAVCLCDYRRGMGGTRLGLRRQAWAEGEWRAMMCLVMKFNDNVA